MSAESAIIPAAGEGTRLQPATRWLPKELLPVEKRPMLEHALREAVEAGIEKIVVVSSPDKPLIQKYIHDLDRRDGPVERNQVELVYQQTPIGLADALREGWKQLGTPSSPVLSLLPDNIYFASPPSPAQTLIENYQGTEHYLTVLHPIDSTQKKVYGYTNLPELESIDENRYQMKEIPEKKSQNENVQDDFSPQSLRGAGRSLITPAFFQTLEQLEDRLRKQNRELDDVPVVQEMIKQDLNVEGIKIENRIFDVGHYPGYAEAWCKYSPDEDCSGEQ